MVARKLFLFLTAWFFVYLAFTERELVEVPVVVMVVVKEEVVGVVVGEYDECGGVGFRA